MNTTTRSRKWRLLFFSLIAAVVAFYIYAFWIEPNWIEVTHHRVKAPVPAPLKIAHLSDLHSYGIGRREQKLFRILETERPDIILITGDTVPSSGAYDQCAEVIKLLRAPLGVWAVRGNHEIWAKRENEHEFFEAAGARLLVNEHAQIIDGLWLVGFDDIYDGSPNIEKAVKDVPPHVYKIALFHSPQLFDKAAGQADLMLAGHTHGGQVRLPYFGPLWLPPFSGNYVQGWFEANGSKMYVSRGVGTSLMNARFLCRPEVAIITLEN
jgi:predicted MPP superfamily phosphohydrolase